MSLLSSLADALHLLGKAIDPSSVTQVHFDFEHSPVDLPGIAAPWTFKATLKGVKSIEADGAKEISYDQSWEEPGETDVEAIANVHKNVVAHIRGFMVLRRDEATFAEQAIMAAMSSSEDLQGMWASGDSPQGEASDAGPPEGSSSPA